MCLIGNCIWVNYWVSHLEGDFLDTQVSLAPTLEHITAMILM